MKKQEITKIRDRSAPRPEIYQYFDYKIFLRDWFEYLKKTERDFSVRQMLTQANVALGTISSVFNGQLPLSHKTLEKISPYLKLNRADLGYLKHLIVLGESNDQEERIRSLRGIQKYLKNRNIHLAEVESYQYLTKWFHVAIREMVDLKGFKMDPKWIQRKLRYTVPIQDIRATLDYLTKHGFVDAKNKKRIRLKKDPLLYDGGFFRIALAEYLGQYLDLAKQSIQNTPRHKRVILGYTRALTQEQFKKVENILEEALQQTAKIETKEARGDSVYHISFEAFPVAETKD